MPLVRKDSAAPPPPPPQAGKLFTGTNDERWSAARAMATADHVEDLSSALRTEGDARVREAILTSLCRIATPESAAAIVPHVASDDASVRRGALDALCSMPQAAAPHLRTMLGDADADVRLLACEITRELPADMATPLLAALLEREEVVNVCAAAIEVLTEIGGPEAIGPLRAAAQRFSDDPFLQFAVEAAIERIKPSDLSRE